MSRLQRGLTGLNSAAAGGNTAGFSRPGLSQAGVARDGAKSFEDLKRLIHSKLVDKLDLSRVSDLAGDTLRREIRLVDETSPMVDARLPDGSRVNAIIPPLALDGPSMSIRRFGANPLKLEDLLNFKAFTPEMAMLMEACIKARLNIIISGGTGCGKTTLLNTLSSFIPSEERIITIEDAAELQLQQDHVVRLETRPADIA